MKQGTENIFQLAKEFGFKVVYASSSSVYGNPIKIPIKEESEKNPINPYAQTKLDDENLLSLIANELKNEIEELDSIIESLLRVDAISMKAQLELNMVSAHPETLIIIYDPNNEVDTL